MTNDDSNPGVSGTRMIVNAGFMALANPPFLLNILRRLSAPAVVCVRHELGERFYYRLGGFVRLVTYSALFVPSVLPFFYGNVIGPICFLAGWAINWIALYWFFHCDRECRREIAARRRTGLIVHSWSAGVPRFGWVNNERTNLRTIPGLLVALGLIVSPLTFALGTYLCFCGAAMFAEAVYRRHIAREATLDAQDRLGSAAAVKQASLFFTAGSDTMADDGERTSAANPLEGFGDILSEP